MYANRTSLKSLFRCGGVRTMATFCVLHIFNLQQNFLNGHQNVYDFIQWDRIVKYCTFSGHLTSSTFLNRAEWQVSFWSSPRVRAMTMVGNLASSRVSSVITMSRDGGKTHIRLHKSEWWWFWMIQSAYRWLDLEDNGKLFTSFSFSEASASNEWRV
jgi:hypothetical protein